MYSQITGNLLEHNAQYIAHQCNCVTNRSAHLSKAVFTRFPYADVYCLRTQPDTLGTIKIKGNGKDKRWVINMFGQYFPGKCKYPNGSKDNPKLREESFQKCLDKISEIEDLESIAFPWGIGCGAAGGDWKNYEKMISSFAKKNFLTDVYIVRLPE